MAPTTAAEPPRPHSPAGYGDDRTRPFGKRGELIVFALIVAQAVFLVAAYLQGHWLVDSDGRGAFTDFVGVWAAGHLVQQGHPAAAYDWELHKALQATLLDRPVGQGNFPWFYPPFFLAVAAALASLPYVTAFVAWLAATFLGYALAIRSIVGRGGWLLAAAFPAVIGNAMVGQNGFLTAALLGGALCLLERRPWLAGVLVGCLAYKPHFGLLLPFALLAGGYWRTVAAASVTVATLIAGSLLIFGADTWQAFFHALPTARGILSDGSSDWAKLQSAYAAIRLAGGSEVLGWWVQVLLGVTGLVGVVALWRSQASFPLKAAGLVVATLLATPYLFLYDLVVLSVPMAFLMRDRHGREAPTDGAGFLVVAFLILIFPLVHWPTGLIATLIVALLTGRHLLQSLIAAPARLGY